MLSATTSRRFDLRLANNAFHQLHGSSRFVHRTTAPLTVSGVDVI
jgi:hypothetical protein